jgi:diaminopimelate decarboxylase
MPRFLTQKEGQSLASRFRTPFFVYSESLLRTRAREVMHFSHRPGFVARYAMKANSNANILRILASEGLHIDASSGYEVERAIAAGISPFHIQLTGQEMPENLRTFVEQGIEFNATSLHQLETFCALFPGKDISLRVNPGLGSGGTNRTNV